MQTRQISAFVTATLCAAVMLSLSCRADDPIGSSSADMPRMEKPIRGLSDNAPPTKEEDFAVCLDLWDPGTHMTKALWKVVCKRLQSKN